MVHGWRNNMSFADFFNHIGDYLGGHQPQSQYAGAKNAIEQYAGQGRNALQQNFGKGIDGMNQRYAQGFNAMGGDLNHGADYLNPYISGGQNGINALGAMLGKFSNPGQFYNQFAKNYQMSAGAQNQLHTGLNAVKNAMASEGLSGSGAEAKALSGYTQGLINQDMNSQFNNVMNTAHMGAALANHLYQGGLSGALTGAHMFGNAGDELGNMYDNWGNSIGNMYGGEGRAIAGSYNSEGQNIGGLTEAEEQAQAAREAAQKEQDRKDNAAIGGGIGEIGGAILGSIL